MTDRCNDTEALKKNTQLKSACDCQKSVALIQQAIDEYETQYTDWKNDLESYRRYKKDHDDWENKQGRFKQYSNYGKKNPFRIEWGWASDDANEYCKKCARGETLGDGRNCKSTNDNRLGSDGYNDNRRDGEWGWHVAGSRKFWTCEKSDAKIAQENQAYKEQYEPDADPEDSSKTWTGLNEPEKPEFNPNINIQCCSQIFDDIKGGRDVNFSDIKQNCTQNINQQVEDASNGVTPSPTTNSPTPSPSPSSGSSSMIDNIKNKLHNDIIGDDYIIPLLIAVILVICCSSFMSLLLLLFSGGNSDEYSDEY